MLGYYKEIEKKITVNGDYIYYGTIKSFQYNIEVMVALIVHKLTSMGSTLFKG